MKILKPGKVEMRKFVCEKCGCIFVANKNETERCARGKTATGIAYEYWAKCPCREEIKWDDGEPYEEPTPAQTDRERGVTFDANTLPCKIGDEVWKIKRQFGTKRIVQCTVSGMYFASDMTLWIIDGHLTHGEWGKVFFATEKEARAAMRTAQPCAGCDKNQERK